MHYIIKPGDSVVCPVCGKMYVTNKRSVCPRTCSPECRKIKASKSLKGRKRSIKSNRVRKGDVVICPICGKQFVAKYKGVVRCCSKECSAKMKSNSLKEHFKNNPKHKKEKISYEEKTGYKHPLANPKDKEKIISKIKSTKLERYGNENYNNRVKAEETCMEKYGVKFASKLEYFVKKAKQTKLERYNDERYSNYKKAEETYFKRTGYKNPSQNPEVIKKREIKYFKKTGYRHPTLNPIVQKKARESLKAHTGYEYPSQNPETLIKIRKTMHKNDSFRYSKDEEKAHDLLEKGLNLKILRNYSSDVYPFNCDFYIPLLDLYIEYQGTWQHGKFNENVIYGPFDENNEIHIEVLKKWASKSISHSSYKAAIKIWTEKDPLKRRVAKENKLNWIEFWSIEEVKKWICQIKIIFSFIVLNNIGKQQF